MIDVLTSIESQVTMPGGCIILIPIGYMTGIPDAEYGQRIDGFKPCLNLFGDLLVIQNNTAGNFPLSN